LCSDLELSGKLGWRSTSTNQFNYLLAKFSRRGGCVLGIVDSSKLKY
jgi:hypothetical protein